MSHVLILKVNYFLLDANKHQLKRFANGSTFLELSKADFGKIHFTVPAYDEQSSIASTIDGCDQQIEGMYNYITHLRKQKKGLVSIREIS